jgi:hypothetical protein
LYAAVIIISAAFFFQQQKAVYFASQIKRNEAKYKYIGDISDCIKNYVEKKKISSFLLKPGSSVWPNGVGVITQLYKSSISFNMEDHLLFVYGSQFKQETKEKDIILLTKEKEPRKSSHRRFLIYHTEGWSVYHQKRD